MAQPDISPAKNASGSIDLGMKSSYNHDLNVSDSFLSLFPDIAEVLRDERLLTMFATYEDLSKKYKSRFHALGLWSLILGCIPLFLASMHLTIGERNFDAVPSIALVAGVSGAISVVLQIILRHNRYRVLWCQAVFCRERLREWHFQQFLDGEFICLIKTNKPAYLAERDRRWNSLLQNLQDGYGLMVEYISYSSRDTNFFVEPSNYPDLGIAKSVYSALWTLRFEHQLRYSRRKTGAEGEPSEMALQERSSFSEAVASAALAGAVCTSALALIIPCIGFFYHSPRLESLSPVIGRILDGFAVGLAIVSAATRAYRAGYTLPDESESYEEYCDKIRESRAIFINSMDPKEKLRQLNSLEEESASELRRFLRMKSRATFLS